MSLGSISIYSNSKPDIIELLLDPSRELPKFEGGVEFIFSELKMNIDHPLLSFLFTFGIESLSCLVLAGDDIWGEGREEGREEEGEEEPVIPYIFEVDVNDYDTDINVYVFNILSETFHNHDYDLNFSDIDLTQPFLALGENNAPLLVLSLDGITSHIFYCQENRPFLYERALNSTLPAKFESVDENHNYLFYGTREQNGAIKVNVIFDRDFLVGPVMIRLLLRTVQTAVNKTRNLLRTSYLPKIYTVLDKLREMDEYLRRYSPQVKSSRK